MENQQPNGKNISESTLFQRFMKKAETYLKHPIEVTKLLNDAFKKATAQKDLGTLAAEAWESLQLLSRMIKAAVSGEYNGIPNSTVVAGVAVFIYFLSPIDLIPDVIPIIGLLDDAALLAWFMASIKTELDKFKAWEATRPAQATAAQEPAQSPSTEVIHHADNSFGTPKYSNQPAGTIDTDQPSNT